MLQIIIPAYNAAEFIGQTLESVLSQKCADDVVVLNNVSTDSTAAVVARYADRGVRCITNERNLGAIGNHNLALELATGEFIKLLSADDVLLPNVLTRQVQALESHPTAGIASCDFIETDANLRPIRQIGFLSGYRKGSEVVRQCVKRVANLVGAPSNLMLRRSMLGQHRFDPNLKWLGDLEFACRLLNDCDYVNIDAPGFFYRRHGDSDSVLGCPLSVRLHDELAFARRYNGGVASIVRVLYRSARSRLSPSRRVDPAT